MNQVDRHVLLSLGAVLLLACGDTPGDTMRRDADSMADVGADAVARDAGVDAGEDASTPDAPEPDAESVDASSTDGGVDTGDVDAGVADAGLDSGPGDLEDPTGSSDFPLADPDTVLASDGTYISYGTTVGAGRGRRCGGTGKLYVPFLVHGTGSSVRISDCAAGDAMPGGPGDWAEPGGGIWASGVVRFGDRYFMYYTASRRGSGQKCIGLGIAGGARGPFVSRGEWACPAAGRWAIDANPVVQGDTLYVAYRDDAITSFPETGISAVRADANGRAVWSTRRDLLRSTDVGWETVRISGTSHVIENPSLFRHDGVWYLTYSGNNWDSARYATGIARCGASPLPATRCAPMRDGVRRPYLGFTGAAGLDPYRGLPGNHQGPGGMDIFQAADGSLRAIWHWWQPSDRSRHSAVGRFLENAGGFQIGP